MQDKLKKIRDALVEAAAHARSPLGITPAKLNRWEREWPAALTLLDQIIAEVDIANHAAFPNGNNTGENAITAENLPEREGVRTADEAVERIRADGWMVAVHNDYRLNGEFHTFWLFTKDILCAKGEGRTDAEALAQVEAAIAAYRGDN